MFSNSGVKNGLFLGIAILIFSIGCYFYNPKTLINSIALLVYILIIYFMYRSAADEKRLNEGYLSFGEALKVTFLTYVIGTLIYSIFTYVMFNIVDPSLNDVMREVSIESAEYVSELLGNEADMDQVYDQLEKQDLKMTFSMVFFNYLIGLIFPGFLFALIMSAITKKMPVT